jgi:hypothetical protein
MKSTQNTFEWDMVQALNVFLKTGPGLAKLTD